MTVALSNPRILRPAAGAAAWLLLGLSGVIGAGWGYGLFFTSVLLLAGAAIAFGFLILTRAFDTGMLRGSAAWLGLIGVWVYVWAFAALAGHYSHETFAGRMELRWILFGPAVLAALAIGWRIKVSGTEEQKFTDTPTAVFLFLVVLSGFVVEGMRLAAAPAGWDQVSFVGSVFAQVVPGASGPGTGLYEVLWLVHVLGSCAFIAYVPVRRPTRGLYVGLRLRLTRPAESYRGLGGMNDRQRT